MVSEQHIYEDFVTIFDELDSTSKGYITLPELIEKIKRFGYKESDAVMKDIFEQADTSRDGKLTQEEFVNAIRICPPEMHRAAYYRRMFSRFDEDGNGTISRHETRSAVSILTPKFTDIQLSDLLEAVDKSKKSASARISIEELIKYLMMKKIGEALQDY